jgi:hypothetical protein
MSIRVMNLHSFLTCTHFKFAFISDLHAFLIEAAHQKDKALSRSCNAIGVHVAYPHCAEEVACQATPDHYVLWGPGTYVCVCCREVACLVTLAQTKKVVLYRHPPTLTIAVLLTDFLQIKYDLTFLRRLHAPASAIPAAAPTAVSDYT